MTAAERMAATVAWRSATRHFGMTLVAHIGCASQAESIELASHAAGVGVDAIAAVSPFYYKPPTVRALVDFLGMCCAVRKAARTKRSPRHCTR